MNPVISMKAKEILGMFLFLGLDQITKWIVQVFLQTELVLIPHFFSIAYVLNQGAAWSLFHGQRIFLIIISCALLIGIFLTRKKYSLSRMESFFYSMLIGGILGNLCDRIFFGYVRDFVSFQFQDYFFPIFNLADSFIVVSALYFFYRSLRGEYIEIKSRRRKSEN